MNFETDPESGQTFKCPYFSLVDYSKSCIDLSEGEITNAVLTKNGVAISIGKKMYGDDTSSYGFGPGYFFLREINDNDSCEKTLRALEYPDTREISSLYYQYQTKSNSGKFCNEPDEPIENYTCTLTNKETSTFKDDEGFNHGKTFSASYKYEWEGNILEFDYSEKKYTEFVDELGIGDPNRGSSTN